MFIGVAGQKQMGKDSLADHLADCLNKAEDPDCLDVVWERDAFALNVKRVFCETFDVDMDFVEEWKVKDDTHPSFDMNVRKSLQFIGDGFRQIQSSIWIDLMFRNLSCDKIISDVRYPNEFISIESHNGLNILIGRTEMLNDDDNSSESLIKPYVQWGLGNFEENFTDLSIVEGDFPPNADIFDVFIRNDGTKEDLFETVETKLVPYVQKWSKDVLHSAV